jgi:toxin ParE1/3/4
MTLKVFSLKIEPLAAIDIQEGISFYNSKQAGLGKRFHKELKLYLNSLKSSPFFQIRYDDIRCLPLKIFPVMIHYTVDEAISLIIVRAVINTSKNPDEYRVK